LGELRALLAKNFRSDPLGGQWERKREGRKRVESIYNKRVWSSKGENGKYGEHQGGRENRLSLGWDAQGGGCRRTAKTKRKGIGVDSKTRFGYQGGGKGAPRDRRAA